MKIIHTSDWHLGQYFYTRSRAAEHQAFLDWLLQQVELLHIDAIIVAGDIFDTGSPPSYAREMYNRFVVALQPTRCQLIILAGNHDSVSTLNESRQLLACLNTQVITHAATDSGDHLLLLSNRQGEPAALLCAIPYLRSRDIVFSQAGLTGKEKQQQLMSAISDYYQRSYQQAVQLRDARQWPDLPIIATGHLTTVGVSTSEAVRDIYIGTLSAFPAQYFPPADYIALGHIHKPQSVGGQAQIRYSGSPIALSFDEADDEKSVTLLEWQKGTPLQISQLKIPCFQPMLTLKGNLSEISQQLTELPSPPKGQRLWLDIEIKEQHYLSDLQQRIEALMTDRPVDIVLLRRYRPKDQDNWQTDMSTTLDDLSVQQVFQRRLQGSDLSEEAQRRLNHLFAEILEQLQQSPEDKP